MDNKKQKRKDWLKGIILIIILFAVVGTGLYFYGRMQRKSDTPEVTTSVSNTIDKYGYTLNDNVTEYYKTEFDHLKEMINDSNVTEEDTATQVAKLFIIDLFSMNYKINKYEVTSAQYYYSDKQDMYKQKVIDNLYNLIEDNAYNDRKQELPEVSDVTTITNKKDTYKLGNKTVSSYLVDLNISYVKDLGYDTKAEVILVNDGNNLSVVSYKAK
jgi:hypothetical protein